MRTIVVSDLHGQSCVFKLLYKTIRDYKPECILMGGDILSGTLAEADYKIMLPQTSNQLQGLSDVLETANCPIYLTPGNHDTYPYSCLEDIPRAKVILDNIITLPNGMKCYMTPWSMKYGVWPWMLSRDIVPTDKLQYADIVVSHGPAYGYYDYVPGEGLTGSKALLEAIDSSNVTKVFTGHIHNGLQLIKAGITDKVYSPRSIIRKVGERDIMFYNVSVVDDEYEMKQSIFTIEL